MTAQNKPRWWPVVRRHGLLAGTTRWLACRQRGHDYGLVSRSYYLIRGWHAPGGIWIQDGLIKVACQRCGQTRLVRLRIVQFADGRVNATSPDMRVTVEYRRGQI